MPRAIFVLNLSTKIKFYCQVVLATVICPTYDLKEQLPRLMFSGLRTTEIIENLRHYNEAQHLHSEYEYSYTFIPKLIFVTTLKTRGKAKTNSEGSFF